MSATGDAYSCFVFLPPPTTSPAFPPLGLRETTYAVFRSCLPYLTQSFSLVLCVSQLVYFPYSLLTCPLQSVACGDPFASLNVRTCPCLYCPFLSIFLLPSYLFCVFLMPVMIFNPPNFSRQSVACVGACVWSVGGTSGRCLPSPNHQGRRDTETQTGNPPGNHLFVIVINISTLICWFNDRASASLLNLFHGSLGTFLSSTDNQHCSSPSSVLPGVYDSAEQPYLSHSNLSHQPFRIFHPFSTHK